MVQTHHVTKRQKTEECTSCMESVMFNSDSLYKIASYLRADALLNLALSSRRFGGAPLPDIASSLSLAEETARRIVHDVATEEERNALPRYDGDNWLSKYNYLQLLQMPLAFDQLVGQHIEYVEGNKSRVVNRSESWATAFSNNIMMAGKHYASFEVCHEPHYTACDFVLGVMRPGKAVQSAKFHPLVPSFFNHFTQRAESRQYNNIVNCCMCYSSDNGSCYSSAWESSNANGSARWDGMEDFGYGSTYKIGMLLDLDEGTLSVYKNGRRLGVMKRGLAGHTVGL